MALIPGFVSKKYTTYRSLIASSAAAELLKPFLFQPFPLLCFDFLIVLPEVFLDASFIHTNLIAEALHLAVIKAIQNLESKLDPT